MNENDAVWEVSEKPDIRRINDEFVRSGGVASVSDGRLRNDRIRFNKWDGRTADYKKHREALRRDPIPYEDAWDGRVYTADGIIEDLGDVLRNAFKRAQFKMRPSGTDPSRSLARAANAEKVMTKYVERDRSVLDEEAEFIWQWSLGYGVSVWNVGWTREVAMKMVPVTFEQLRAAADRASEALGQLATASLPGQPGPIPDEVIGQLQQVAALPDQIMDPNRDAETIEVFKQVAAQLAGQLFENERNAYGDEWLRNYELSDKQARKVVRELREKQRAEFPAPYLHKDQPCVTAREVGYDYFAPPEMTDPEQAPWHMIREFLSPAQILENKVTDGWDPEWCDLAIKTAGQTTVWGEMIAAGDVELDDDSATFQARMESSKSGLVEVIHCFARYTTPEGIPQIWCTVYCPNAMRAPQGTDELYAKHYPLEDASSYGFFPFRWQKKRRNFHQNIGVPELVGSDQQLIKRTLDQLTDRGDNELNPPWLVATRLGMRYKAGAGAQIPIKRKGDVEQMPPPTGNPQLGFELIKDARYRLDNYFGLMTENVSAAKWQTKLQGITQRYLGSAEAMFRHYWRLIQRNADSATLQRLSGGDTDFPSTPEEIEGEFEVSLYFDVKDLDMEFVFKKLDAVAKMAVPLDRAGVIDLAALVKLIVLAIDPTYAQALITDKEGASRRVYRDVDNEVLRMFNGNEADFVENDPTAQMKLQFLDQVVAGNPAYQAALSGRQPNPLFIERIQKYQANLHQSVAQQENKTVGRLGVVPDNMQLAAG